MPETVGVDRRTGGDVLLDDGAHRRRREIWQNDEADAPRTVVTLLDGHQPGDGATVFQLPASLDARLRTANPGGIDLDVAMEGLPCRVHHRSAQLVEHQPRRFVAPQPELTLDQERRDGALVRRHQVRSPEPLGERGLRVVQHRAGGERPMPTRGARPASFHDHVGAPMTAAWADEALRPATGCQVWLAGLLRCELTSELVQILGKRRARHAPTLQMVAG